MERRAFMGTLAVGLLAAPRGEVGVMFAGAGLAAGVIAEDLCSATHRRGDSDDVRGPAPAEGALSRLGLKTS